MTSSPVPVQTHRTRRRLLMGALLLALPLIGLGCRSDITPQPVTLNYWRVFDPSSSMQEIIDAYQAAHPHVTINYRQVRFPEYEQQMLEALAEDRGPDIFSVHNTWIGEYQSKIAPLPTKVTVPEQRITGTIREEIVTENVTKPSITPAQIRKQFVDVVPADVIRTNANGKQQVLGLPLGVDTLVMFYNRNILNNAGIATPPEDWQQFLTAVARTTRLNEGGQIAVAGTALGTADNVPRYSDIVSVLMMQNGARMTDANGFATFQNIPPGFPNPNYNPGLEALRFYTDFADPTKEVYSWNDQMPDALEAFLQGRVAFFFGYSYHIPTLRTRAPQLRWEIAPLPQADAANNRVNFANYWIETVSKKTEHRDVAWDFIQFATSQQQVQKHLNATGKPTARRALIDQQAKNPTLAPFVEQLLTARSWYRGRDAGTAEAAMGNLIRAMVNGTENLSDVVANTVKRINATINL